MRSESLSFYTKEYGVIHLHVAGLLEGLMAERSHEDPGLERNRRAVVPIGWPVPISDKHFPLPDQLRNLSFCA